LNLKSDILDSNYAFKCNVQRYIMACLRSKLEAAATAAATEARVREQERLLAEEGKAEEDKKRKVGLYSC
jgi:hypothetical protein